MKLIPKPKKIEILEGIFECILIEKVNYSAFLDNRILKELKKINVCIKQTESLDAPLLFEKDQSLACEEYKILIKNKQIKVIASTLNGAFYGTKTLQQILKEEELRMIYGGAITGTFINAIIKGVNSFLDLGRSIGTAIRRIGAGSICPL